MKNKKYLFGIWLILTICSIVFGINFTQSAKYYRFVNHGIITTAIVEKLELENHRTIYYRYQVGDQQFIGIGNGGKGNPRFEDIGIGHRLIAYYDAERPWLSCLGAPQNHFQASINGVLFIGILVPLVFTFGLYRHQFFKERDSEVK